MTGSPVRVTVTRVGVVLGFHVVHVDQFGLVVPQVMQVMKRRVTLAQVHRDADPGQLGKQQVQEVLVFHDRDWYRNGQGQRQWHQELAARGKKQERVIYYNDDERYALTYVGQGCREREERR